MVFGFKNLIALAALAVSSAAATAGPSLLGLYLLNGDGKNAAGSAPDLTTQGSGPTYVAGLNGQAASFTGSTSDFLRADINASRNVNPTFTWGAWVKLANAYDVSIFLSNDKGGFGRFTGTLGGAWAAAGADNWQVSSVATTDAWTFVAETFDGTTLKLYVDGALALTAGDANLDNNTFIDIGRNADGSTGFNGLMDSVFFFDDMLTADEMLTVYRGGAGGDGVLQVADPGDPGGNVPEPHTLALALLALGATALTRRSRTRRMA